MQTSPRIVALRRTPEPAAMPVRAVAVDALRGLAILGMVLVAVEPLRVLPAAASPRRRSAPPISSCSNGAMAWWWRGETSGTPAM